METAYRRKWSSLVVPQASVLMEQYDLERELRQAAEARATLLRARERLVVEDEDAALAGRIRDALQREGIR